MVDVVLPEDMKSRMERFPQVDWSSVVREAVSEKLEKLTFVERFVSESEMTEEDALEFGRELNKRLAKRYSGD